MPSYSEDIYRDTNTSSTATPDNSGYAAQAKRNSGLLVDSADPYRDPDADLEPDNSGYPAIAANDQWSPTYNLYKDPATS